MKNNHWVEDELRKIELQRQSLKDQYNTMDPPVQMDRVEKIFHSSLPYKPKKGQTWKSYADELQTHVNYAVKKNYKVHIENNGNKAWWTHRQPSQECFMCEDKNFYQALHTIIQIMADQHPDNIF